MTSWLTDGLIAWGLVSFPAGVLSAKLLRSAPKPAIIVQPVPQKTHRGDRIVPLKFGFTLPDSDGVMQLTGEEIPAGEGPTIAAKRRSITEGKNYGARRI